MRADLFWDQGGEGRLRGLSLKPAARKIKRKTETMSLSLCMIQNDSRNDKKIFSPIGFMPQYFFPLTRVITSHLQTFGSTLVVGKALDKVNMVSVSFH